MCHVEGILTLLARALALSAVSCGMVVEPIKKQGVD